MIRTEGDPTTLARAARYVVARLDANVPVSEVQPLEDVVAQSIAEPRLLMFLLAGFGSVGLLLAALGIYGVISYAVSHRTREFGIRLAVGACPADLRRQVVRGGAKLAVLGLLIGIVGGSALLVRFLESVLYEIEPHDPPTFGAVVVVLGGVALLSSYLPACHAARVDPMTSLGER